MAEPRNPREPNAKPLATEPDRHGPGHGSRCSRVAGIVIAAWFVSQARLTSAPGTIKGPARPYALNGWMGRRRRGSAGSSCDAGRPRPSPGYRTRCCCTSGGCGPARSPRRAGCTWGRRIHGQVRSGRCRADRARHARPQRAAAHGAGTAYGTITSKRQLHRRPSSRGVERCHVSRGRDNVGDAGGQHSVDRFPDLSGARQLGWCDARRFIDQPLRGRPRSQVRRLGEVLVGLMAATPAHRAHVVEAASAAEER